DAPLPWRPFYLQRRILATFAATFVGLIVTIEVLWSYSNQGGLGYASPTARYLWAYGPVGVFAVASVIWSRVDYQAKSAAPWLRLAKEPSDAEHTLLLDYISMSQPKAVLRSVQNGDMTVACTSGVAILLKLMIIVSAALVTLTEVDIDDQIVPVTLQTEFAGNASSLMNATTTALFTMIGLQQDRLSDPAGVFASYVFQQFSANPSIDTDIIAEVDGLSTGLDCETAQLSLAGVQFSENGQQFNTSFKAGSCNVTMPIFSRDFADNANSFFARFGQGACGGSTKPEDQRIVVVIGRQDIDANSLPQNGTGPAAINGTIATSTQLLCNPTYNISRVVVDKIGATVLDVAPVESSPTRMLSAVQPWDIAQAFFASYNTSLASQFSDVTPSFYANEILNVDAAMHFALGLRIAEGQTAMDPLLLLEPSTLQELVTEYFQRYSALLASSALTQPTNTASIGTAAVNGEKIVMGALGAQFLTVLLAISVGLVALAMLYVPKWGFLPRDPSTIMDTAALIAHSRPLLQSLRGAGGGSMSVIRERLKSSSYYTGVEAYEHASSRGVGYFKIFGGQGISEANPDYIEPTDDFPYPDLLHPIQRVFALLIVAAIIVALELSLQVSMRNNGLGLAGDVSYLHLLWTAGPTLVMTLVAMYFSSTDMTLRTLAPYAGLRKEATFSESISINLADKAGPSVFLHALKSRNLAVAGSTVALFFSLHLAVAVSALFTTVTVPGVTNVQLSSVDTFAQSDGTEVGNQNGTILASLILDSNFSYPAFTFEDMSFPILDTQGNVSLADDSSITVTLPALRPLMQCKLFQQADIRTNFTQNATSLQIRLNNEPSGALNLSIAGNATIASNPDAFFGVGKYAPIAQVSGEASHWVYAWGQLADAGSSKVSVKSISAWACNETMQQVGALTTLSGSSLAIDPRHPPVPIESTAAALSFQLDGINYQDLMNVSGAPALLDSFFSTLVAGQRAVRLSDLGNTDTNVAQSIANAITRQHKIIRTQVINTANRQPIEAVSIGKPLSSAIVGKPSLFFGFMTSRSFDGGAVCRVAQDMVATRILQVLLAATLVASIASWIGLPKPNILPRSPNSIGSVAGFLADGNMFGLLGRGAEWQGTKELRAFFMDGMHVMMRFKIGWDRLRRRRREETLAVWGMNGSCPKDQV
ncbi:hypothetical protein GQ53DRAFT_614796, partial [Thozetella sp. PMI_491]